MTKDQLRQHILMLAMELTQLKKENAELIEFKAKQEEMMCLVGASIYYLAKPKTAIDAEKLQKGKEIFEKIMLRRLHLLEEENKELKEENELLKECNIRNYTSRSNTDNMNLKLLEENKSLKESLDIATKCSSKEEDGIIRLSEENRKLKEELERYKKQYEHSMGED